MRRGEALSSIEYVFAGYVLAGLASFLVLRTPTSIAATYLLGLVALPVAHYPEPNPSTLFPFEIIGLGLPAQMLITKAWIAPVVALVGGTIFDVRRVAAFRPVWIDVPMLMWVLWPLASAQFAMFPRPGGAASALYLAGVWGAPYLLGRIWFSDEQGRAFLVRAIAVSALVLLPVAVIEGVRPPSIYTMVYGYHPFLTDGIDRYIGYRPLALFEDGNQYGIWIALSALGALGLCAAQTARSHRSMLTAGILVVMAFASQSAGGVLSLIFGAVLFWAFYTRRVSQRLLILVGSVFLVCGAVYATGIIPVRQIATETRIGAKALSLIRQTGRGSFAWRVSQDQKMLPLIANHPVVGHSQWDWWARIERRPWGLAMLILGQFGAIGLLLAGMAFAMGSLSTLWRATSRPVQPVSIIAALMVSLAAADGLLNAFLFLPAFALAGALVVAVPRTSRDMRSLTRAPIRQPSSR